MTEYDVQDMMEGLVKYLWKKGLGVDLPDFPRIPYAEAMGKYGSDKPDLRVKLEFTELTDIMKTVDFKVFAVALPISRTAVWSPCAFGGAKLTQGDRRLHRLRRDLRRQGPRLDQG